MRKKVGIMTFHAAHNYGSVLQAYALQNVIQCLDYDCEIIDFRTEAQKDQYRPLTKRKGMKYIIKNAYFLLNYNTRKEKYNCFEKFIRENLVRSETEYGTLQELESAELSYDAYISGSDQIWNTAPNDASMAYFLPFVKSGKRIAYAPSFGQIGDIKHKEEIAQYLKKYDALSVREEFGRQLIREMTGREVPLLLDPTMLLSGERWTQLIEKTPIIQGDYIFFYTLFADKEMIDMAKRVSTLLGVPVVISNVSNQYEIFSGFVKRTQAGPLEFLNLIQYAKMVCTSSFHGTVFSILLHKPFMAIRGISDNRISTLLKLTGLEKQSVQNIDELDENRVKRLLAADYTKTDCALELERRKAMAYLQNALTE